MREWCLWHWDSCSRPNLFISSPSDFLAVWKIPCLNFVPRSVSPAEVVRTDFAELGLGEAKVLCCFQPSSSEALGHLPALAVPAQSSLHVVTKVVLRRSEPRLLQEISAQAQDVAALSFSSFVIDTCLFPLCPLAVHILFPKSPDSSSQGSEWATWGTLEERIPNWLPPSSAAMISLALNDGVQQNGDSSALDVSEGLEGNIFENFPLLWVDEWGQPFPVCLSLHSAAAWSWECLFLSLSYLLLQLLDR